MDDPADLTLVDLLPLLRARRLSARELLESCLRRVELYEPQVRAFVTLTPERAEAAAVRADQDRAAGRPVGPLAGVPVVVKDLFCIRGVPTTASSRVLAGHDPGIDAAAWVRLRDAGAGLLGKTTLHEFAYGTGSHPTRNPWDLTRTPGGSSGGSAAALAARMSPVALGSDTGGSLRIPAAACGLSSLRPTSGRVSAYGALPLAPSLDAVGPMARRMRDVSLLLGLLAGHDPRDARSLALPVPGYPDAPADLAGVRIGLPRSTFWEDADAAILAACRKGLDRLVQRGEELVEVEPPHRTAEVLSVPGAYGHTVGPEALEQHAGWLAEREELYSDDLRARFALARQTTAEQRAQAQADRTAWADGWRRVFAAARLDAIAHPTIPEPPSVVVASEHGPGPTIALAKAWPLCGFPALSVPVGVDPRGLPVGLQLAALPEQEAELVGIGISLDEDVQLFRHAPGGLG